MEEMKPSEQKARRGLLLVTISLTVVALTMAALLALTLQAAGTVEEAKRGAMLRLSLVCLVALLVVMLLLVWAVLRYISLRTRPSGEHQRTKYIDAWSLSAKRLKLPEDETPREDEEDDSLN